MAGIRLKWRGSGLIEIVAISFLMGSVFVSAKGSLQKADSSYNVKDEEAESDYLTKVLNFLWQPGRLGYEHVWPVSPTVVVLSWLYSFLGIDVVFYLLFMWFC